MNKTVANLGPHVMMRAHLDLEVGKPLMTARDHCMATRQNVTCVKNTKTHIRGNQIVRQFDAAAFYSKLKEKDSDA